MNSGTGFWEKEEINKEQSRRVASHAEHTSPHLMHLPNLSATAPVHPGTAVYTAKETHKDMQIPAAGTQTQQKNTPAGQRSAEPWVDKQRAPNLGGAGRRSHGPGGAI